MDTKTVSNMHQHLHMTENDWAELGYSDIGKDHKALFRMLCGLELAVERGALSDISVILERLSSYSMFHFRSEENQMRAAGYPDVEQHAAEHNRFTTKISLLKHQLYRSDLGRELLDFVSNWFRTHTMDADGKFVSFLKERTQTVKASPRQVGQAY